MTRTVVQQPEQVRLSIATFLEGLQTDGFVRSLLLSLRDFAPEYLPDSFKGAFVDERHEDSKGPVVSLGEETTQLLLQALETPKLGKVMLTRGSPPSMTIALPTRFRTGLRHYYVHLSIQRHLVRSTSERQTFLRVAQRLFLTCEGFFGEFGTFHHMKKEPLGGAPGVNRLVVTNLERGLPPADWGFLLGPDYVSLIGADRIKRAPCEVVREFDNGRFILLLAKDFETLDADEDLLEERRRRLVEHFGPEYFSYVMNGQSKVVLPRFARKTE